MEENGTHASDVVTPESLHEAFDGKVTRAQANVLLQQVDNWIRGGMMAKDIDSNDVLRLVGRVDRNLRDLRQEMNIADTGQVEADKIQESAKKSGSHFFSMGQGQGPMEQGIGVKDLAIINAKLKRLEAYTAHRMDRIDNKIDKMIAKLDNVVGTRQDEALLELQDVLSVASPKFMDDGIEE